MSERQLEARRHIDRLLSDEEKFLDRGLEMMDCGENGECYCLNDPSPRVGMPSYTCKNDRTRTAMEEARARGYKF